MLESSVAPCLLIVSGQAANVYTDSVLWFRSYALLHEFFCSHELNKTSNKKHESESISELVPTSQF